MVSGWRRIVAAGSATRRVIAARVASETTAAAPAIATAVPAPSARATARTSQGRTWPPNSSTVQTGSAAGVAMPSCAFFEKPAQD